MMSESDAFFDNLHTVSVTVPVDGKRHSISAASGGAGGGVTESATQVDCFHNLQNVDVWLAMQLYNTDLIDLDSTMLQYNAFCKQQQKKANSIGVSVGELLKSTVKVSFTFHASQRL